jgi:hypothetical protein
MKTLMIMLSLTMATPSMTIGMTYLPTSITMSTGKKKKGKKVPQLFGYR